MVSVCRERWCYFTAMTSATPATALDPAEVASWARQPFEVLFSLRREDVQEPQRQALVRRFESLRKEVAALDKLAKLVAG